MTALDTLRAHGHRKVKAVAKEDSPVATALFEFCRGWRSVWSKAEWDHVLSELDKSNETIKDWLFLRE